MNNKAVEFAKSKMQEVIYNISQFENLNMTFPETETILAGIKVNNIDEYEANIIINLKRAWKDILINNNSILNLDYIKKINSIAADKIALFPGQLRNKVGTVGGVKEPIETLIEEEIDFKINEINNLKDPIEKVLEFIPFAITNQLFWDGNKRTAFLIANSILIANDIGIISIPESKYVNFMFILNDYYNNKSEYNLNKLKNILKENIMFIPKIN